MPWRECCKMDERLWISSATDTRNNVARRCQANPRMNQIEGQSSGARSPARDPDIAA